MLLSGNRIAREVQDGQIELDPFDLRQLNPNSYNVRLSPVLWTYDEIELDMAKDNRGRHFTIPDRGLVLQPNKLYLGVTVEYIGTDRFVPMVEGRSSVGRLGLSVHAAAGFCDRGFHGRITLELQVAQALRVFPFVQLAQVCFHEVDLEGPLYAGKYNNDRNSRPMPSKLWKEVQHELAHIPCPTPQSVSSLPLPTRSDSVTSPSAVTA